MDLFRLIFPQNTARQHEAKLVELSASTRGQQADVGRAKSEAQASAAQSQASQLKAKRAEAELQVGVHFVLLLSIKCFMRNICCCV